MTATPNVTVTSWEYARAEAGPIRHQVFVLEQNVPPALEMDERDAECRHALARDADGTPIGTGRLLPDGHIGRMAVLPHCRGTGAGSALLNALLNEARRLGYPEVVLSAQYHARGFYERHGFRAHGNTYQEAGIEHIEMRLRLA